MKNFFRTIGTFLGFNTTPFDGNIIPKNPEPTKRLKSEVLPEHLRQARIAEKAVQAERSLALRMKRYGLQKFTDGVNTVYARNEKNGTRKLRNLQNA